MAKDDPHFRLRIPAELKAVVEESAAKNKRSINAEIVSIIENAFSPSRSDAGDDEDFRYLFDVIKRTMRNGGSVQMSAPIMPPPDKKGLEFEKITIFSSHYTGEDAPLPPDVEAKKPV